MTAAFLPGTTSAQPERELLLELLKGDAGDDIVVHRLAAVASWPALLEAAGARLHPLLAHEVTRRALASTVPADARATLTAASRAAVIMHLQRVAGLRRVTGPLGAGGIGVVVLKGMALAHTAYPRPSLRAMSDIDIWVASEDLDETQRVLLANGWRHPPRMAMGAYSETDPALGPTRILELPRTPVLLEMHSSPKSLAILDAAELRAMRERALPAMLSGVPVRVLRPADSLTHLCLHVASAHRFGAGLPSLVDIQRLTASEGRIDWRALAARHLALGVSVWTWLALHVARRLLAAPVPDEYFLALSPPVALDELTVLAEEQLWADPAALPWAVSRLARGSAAQRARWLLTRLTRLSGKEPGEGGRLRTAWRRTRHDLAVKGPYYLRALRAGALAPGRVRRGVALERRRERIAELTALGPRRAAGESS